MALIERLEKMPIAPTQSSPMDRVYRRIDFEQLKMPIGLFGFLKRVWVFCLIVFAAFHGWQFDLDIKCGPPTKKNQTERATYEYHSLDISGYKVHRCNDSDTEVFLFKDDFGSGTDFYSYLIPLSLFLTTGMLLFYIFSYGVYASDDRLPILDLTVTALLAVFWMFGTLFFSISARRIEEATKPENVNATLAAIDICGAESVNILLIQFTQLWRLLRLLVLVFLFFLLEIFGIFTKKLHIFEIANQDVICTTIICRRQSPILWNEGGKINWLDKYLF
uniref:Uncharacterized protein n=1 Tax=Meloidogyne enterolobii TaxID=390850 RepID=A0A6V7Y484_MELEN|nr:unnamed protein product [Meloidogyne enterolobii]